MLLFCFNTKAQTYGCLVGSTTTGTVYTDVNFLGYYLAGGNQYKTVAPNCPRVQLGFRSGDCSLAYWEPVTIDTFTPLSLHLHRPSPAD